MRVVGIKGCLKLGKQKNRLVKREKKYSMECCLSNIFNLEHKRAFLILVSNNVSHECHNYVNTIVLDEY